MIGRGATAWGGLALHVMTISPLVKATLLYAALSGDEQRNFDYVYRASNGQRGVVEYRTPSWSWCTRFRRFFTGAGAGRGQYSSRR